MNPFVTIIIILSMLLSAATPIQASVERRVTNYQILSEETSEITQTPAPGQEYPYPPPELTPQPGETETPPPAEATQTPPPVETELPDRPTPTVTPPSSRSPVR